MYQNRKIRQAAYNIIKPIEKSGVETVEFIDEDKITNKVAKSDAKYFVPPDEQEEPLQESIREVYVTTLDESICLSAATTAAKHRFLKRFIF
jgi:hypothetical protein